jgi:uncharacterized protein (DUF2141 family)
MKKSTFLLALSFLFTSISIAQELPARSPLSVINQKIGLCDMSITYSRPSARNRAIFGSLVPYGEVWRLGANECTTISITKPVTFGRTALDTGTYALFAIPQEDGKWNIIFNSDSKQWGSMSYDSEKDVANLIGGASKNEHTETFEITINNVSNYGGTILIKWSDTKVEVPFTLDTDGHVKTEIDRAVAEGKELDQVHYKAANYYLQTKKDYTTAMTHIDKSIAIKEAYFNFFLKAQVLHETGDNKAALKLGKKAKKLAKKDKKPGWVEYMDKNMADWK